jgi:hypothetical protein
MGGEGLRASGTKGPARPISISRERLARRDGGAGLAGRRGRGKSGTIDAADVVSDAETPRFAHAGVAELADAQDLKS